MNEPIITSILDLDLYKLTVQQALLHNAPSATGEYHFTCRNKDKVDLLKYVPLDELLEEIYNLGKLRLQDHEYYYLKNTGAFADSYLDFLRVFQFFPLEQISVVRDLENNTYKIVAKGTLVHVMLYETLILSIVNEIFARNYVKENACSLQLGQENLNRKIKLVEEYNYECERNGDPLPKIIEFGTRRRFSAAWQENVTRHLAFSLYKNLVGTSNVHLAHKLNLAPIGTFGHEYVMAMQGLYPVQDAQRKAFEIWLKEYKGAFGIALTDTFGDGKFFKDFTPELMRAYQGVRHDSGNPFAYAVSIIEMYRNNGIDPLSKKLVFSDGLDIPTTIQLHRETVEYIQPMFGIGTNLTNDVGIPVLHNVMKLAKCNGQPVVKLSANPAKATCISKEHLEYVKMAIANY